MRNVRKTLLDWVRTKGYTLHLKQDNEELLLRQMQLIVRPRNNSNPSIDNDDKTDEDQHSEEQIDEDESNEDKNDDDNIIGETTEEEISETVIYIFSSLFFV